MSEVKTETQVETPIIDNKVDLQGESKSPVELNSKQKRELKRAQREAQKSEPKASKSEKTEKTKETKKPAPTQPSYVDYGKGGLHGTKRVDENTPQVVPDFNDNRKDKHTERARAAFNIFSFLIQDKAKKLNLNLADTLKRAATLEKKGDRMSGYLALDPLKLHSRDFVVFIKSETGYDFEKDVPFPDNGLHRGLHAISKTETRETRDDKKSGVIYDSFARGARELIRKDTRVGINTNGFYHVNPLVEYPITVVDKTEARQWAKRLVATVKGQAE